MKGYVGSIRFISYNCLGIYTYLKVFFKYKLDQDSILLKSIQLPFPLEWNQNFFPYGIWSCKTCPLSAFLTVFFSLWMSFNHHGSITLRYIRLLSSLCLYALPSAWILLHVIVGLPQTCPSVQMSLFQRVCPWLFYVKWHITFITLFIKW